MKNLYKIGGLVLAVLASSGLKAQMYVSPNSYVYVNDRMVYVKQDIDLQNNGNIYLRNEAQLLQGTAAGSANKGLGKLSVFQEGTVNNFAYNYWCSPVGEANATAGNSAFSVAMLNRPINATASTPATLLGAGVFDGTASPLAIADRWVFKFLSSTTYNQWFAASGMTPTILAGQGFTMKGSSGADNAPLSYQDNGTYNNPGSRQRYDFRGKANDGNIAISVGAGTRTLTGNPYPSAIDLKAFLLAAAGTTQNAYFWEQDPTTNSHLIAAYRGGYGTYSPLFGPIVSPYGNMGVYNPATFRAYDDAGNPLSGPTTTGTAFQRRFCPIGQGFMIEGTTGGTVTMRNNYRVYIKEGFYSDFNRNAQAAQNNGFLPHIESVSGFDYTTVSTAEVPQIRFQTLLNNAGVKTVTLAMVPGASDGVEIGMEGKSPDFADIDMYFAHDNAEYVISVIDFDATKRVPVGFKANIQSTFKIKANEMINFEQAEKVFLYDKVTGVYHDIKNVAYEFSLPAGVVNDRYEITFMDDSALAVPELAADTFMVFQNNDRQLLTVTNPKLMDIKSVSLYDLTGKLIFGKTQSEIKDSYEFSTAGLSEAVYLVKVLTADNQRLGKKVTIFHKK